MTRIWLVGQVGRRQQPRPALPGIARLWYMGDVLFPPRGSRRGPWRHDLALGLCLSRWPEPVTNSPHRLDEWGSSGSSLEFGTQPGDVDIHCPGIDEKTVSPHAVNQVLLT
jgi:hypothetical protein